VPPAEATAAGYTQEQIETAVTSGRWRRLRRGLFCPSGLWTAASLELRHALLAEAVLRATANPWPIALSHTTAAAVHGLPLPRRLLERITLTIDSSRGACTRYSRDHVRQVAPLTETDLVRLRGLPVTSVARTVTDCLRHLPALDAIPIADAGLARSSTTLDEVRAVLAQQAGWPYAGAAAVGLRLVDGRRESPLESRSAVVMCRYELPPAEPQVRIYDAGGSFVARVDFAWLRHGGVGEADGRGKYAGDDPVAVFDAEKDRQARLEALGLLVVHWNGQHLRGDPPLLVQRLRIALAQGSRRRFVGRAA
jgi:hypothetical protein